MTQPKVDGRAESGPACLFLFLRIAHVGTATLGCPAEQSSAVAVAHSGTDCVARALLPAKARGGASGGAFLRLASAYRFAAITLSIVLLIAHPRPPWIVASHRFVEVSLGIAVALLAAEVWRVPGTKAG